MYVCILRTFAGVYIYIYMYHMTCRYKHTYTCVYTYCTMQASQNRPRSTYNTDICARMHVCMYINVHIHIHMYRYIHFIHVCIYIYACTLQASQATADPKFFPPLRGPRRPGRGGASATRPPGAPAILTWRSSLGAALLWIGMPKAETICVCVYI